MNLEWFICARYLLPNNRHSLVYLVNVLAIIGIVIGVMVLVVVTAVVSGFESELEYRILGVDPHVMITNHGQPISNYSNIVSNLNKIDGVKSAVPVIYAQTFLRGNRSISGAVIKGIDFLKFTPSCSVFTEYQKNCVSVTSFKNFLHENGPIPIVLGTVLANKLGVSCGDFVYSISSINGSNMPLFVPFKVVALLHTGIYQYDEILAYTNLNDLQSFFKMNDTVNSIEIKVNSSDKTNVVAKKITDRLESSFLIMHWMQTHENLFLALKIQKTTVCVVLFLINIVAAVTVGSALIMTVLEKVADIAVLKAMGISNFSIRKIFIFRGMLVTLVGTVVGLLFGLFICALIHRYEFLDLPGEVYFLNNLPVNVSLKSIATISFSTMIVCFIFIFYSANKASLLNPIDSFSKK